MNTVTDKELWRDAFGRANAIVALEGGELSEPVARLQDQVAEGVISFDDAIASLTRMVREASANAKT